MNKSVTVSVYVYVNSHCIFNHCHFLKSFIIYRQFLFSFGTLEKIFLQKCFIFKDSFKKSKKYSKMQVSNNFKNITLNWKKIYSTLRKNWIHKTVKKEIKINTNQYHGTKWTNKDYNIYDFLYEMLLVFIFDFQL